MRKSDRKRDNAIREALTLACEWALERGDGFRWLTHQVDYDRFPQSLSVLCVYQTNSELKAADTDTLGQIIGDHLDKIGITLKDIRRHIAFDTEENCEAEHGGRWNHRLQ